MNRTVMSLLPQTFEFSHELLGNTAGDKLGLSFGAQHLPQTAVCPWVLVEGLRAPAVSPWP